MIDDDNKVESIVGFMAVCIGWFIVLATMALIVLNIDVPIMAMPLYMVIMIVISIGLVQYGIKLHKEPVECYVCIKGDKDE